MENTLAQPIKAIIGLGNPGPRFTYTRHNIGFRIIDILATHYQADWKIKDVLEVATIQINNRQIILVKPQTFMNNSGKAIPFLSQKGIKQEEILVIHDELELPFGSIKFKFGGSARGHNGLRSIITHGGENFARLRFGIGRPEDKNTVADYVLQKFDQNSQELEHAIDQAVITLEQLLTKST